MSGDYNYKRTMENEQDAVNEMAIAKTLAAKWHCQMEKNAKFSTFDYVAMREKIIVAFIEMRCRSHKINVYPDVYINLKKLLEAHLIESATDTKCFFVVQFADCLAYCRLNKKLQITKSSPKWNTRIAKAGYKDTEEVALIPISQFQKIHCAVPRSLSQANQR